MASSRAKANNTALRNEEEIGSILNSMRQIVRVLRVASRAAEKDVGLSAAQLFVIHKLATNPALSLNELAARTHTHQSSVSVVVQRLVERGLVTRVRSGNDGRQIELSITPSAKRLVDKSPGAAQDQLIQALDRMTAAQRRDLVQLLAKLVDALGGPKSTAPMFFEDAPARKPRPPRKRATSSASRAQSR